MAAAGDSGGRRLQAIDLLRGIAIVAMAAYHATWDLAYYGLVSAGLGIDPFWVTIQRAILSSFLLLVGAGLVLGHGDGIRWRAFFRRWLLLVVAAAAVSAGTYWLFADYFAFFGVLHAIALGSLLALPLVRAPLWLTLGIAAIVLGLPAVFSSSAFDTPALAWIGFFVTSPETTDLVPMFPWFGVILIGVAGMRLLRPTAAFAALARWQSTALPVRGLAFLGRWSLIVYLVHQPLLLAVIAPLGGWLNPPAEARDVAFTQQCTASCGTAGGAAPYCTAYCRCALDLTTRGELWDALNASPRDPSQQLAIDQVGQLCTAMAK